MAKGKANFSADNWFERLPFLIDIISVILLFYFAVLLVTTPFYLGRIRESESKKAISQSELAQSLKSLDSYVSILSTHPLFGIMKQAVTAPARSACDDFKTKYLLAGIVSGEENEAILNDRATRDTRFIKTGENIDGAVIQSIKPQSIVLDCSGKQLELAIEEN